MAIYNREDPRTALPQLEKQLHGEIEKLSTDYVVEQGTSGYWSWRKWSSGRAEAWGACLVSAKAGSSWVTNLYYSDESVALPSGVFNVAPERIIATGSQSQWTAYGVWDFTTTSFTCRFTKPNSNSMAISGHFYVIGTWK